MSGHNNRKQNAIIIITTMFRASTMYQTQNQMLDMHCIILRNPGKSPQQPSKFGIIVPLL